MLFVGTYVKGLLKVVVQAFSVPLASLKGKKGRFNLLVFCALSLYFLILGLLSSIPFQGYGLLSGLSAFLPESPVRVGLSLPFPRERLGMAHIRKAHFLSIALVFLIAHVVCT